jgi:hypothetical protein
MASGLQQKIEIEAKAFQGLQKGAQATFCLTCCVLFSAGTERVVIKLYPP